MNRERVLYALFILLTGITVLHFTGIDRFWYWTYWWFDLATHFLFGLWVGLFVLWIIFLSRYFRDISFGHARACALALVVIGIIGVLWEVFEVWAGIPIREGYALDTALDLLMDLSGAFVGYLFFISPWIQKR